MRGVKVFYLDLICNALGAMLMLFFLMAARQQIRPTTRLAGTLYIEALSQEPDAEIGIWVKEPGPTGHILFEDEIDDQNGRNTAQPEGAEPSQWFFGRAEEHHFNGFDHLRGNATGLVQIRNPLQGCWTIGAYYKDDPALLSQNGASPSEGSLRVWYRRPMIAKEDWSGNPTALDDRDVDLTPVPMAAPTDGRERQLRIGQGTECKQ